MMELLLIFFFLIIPSLGISQNVNVSNAQELVAAYKKAKPGDVIFLEDGGYEGVMLLDKVNGKKSAPVTIKSVAWAKAKIHSKIEIKGNFIQLEGLAFEANGSLELLGNSIKVSHCLWDDSKSKKWLKVQVGSTAIEIAHNTFQNKTYNLKYPKGCQLLQIVVSNKNERHYIHHNLFKNIPEGSGNGFETLQLITHKNPFDPPPGASNTVIEDNYFERANGEAEIISIKSNGNFIRRNIFNNCKGSLVLRHGDNNIVSENIFFGTDEPKSGGIRIQGSGHLVLNNYFQDMGAFGIGMMDGTPDDLYIRVSNVQLLFNTFINCQNTLQIGINHSKHPNGTPPINCIVEGNVFFFDRGKPGNTFIEYVKGDHPVAWEWNNNLCFGRSNARISGIRNENPQFKSSDNGMFSPSENTPSTKHISTDKTDYIEYDLLGKSRGKIKTLGALQFSNSLTHTILAEGNYGANHSVSELKCFK